MSKKEWHRCDGCGKREKLQAGKRHWCKCHPAGFVMVAESIRRISSAVTGGLRVLVAASSKDVSTVG